MQGVKFGRNHVDLQANIFCMKRQLTIILDENHLLKVKIRRLENELTKKKKYIDYLHMNAQKRIDSRRMTYESASSTILKLKRENEELREILLKRNREDQKRNIHMKTMLLYKQVDTKSNRKPQRKSSRIINSQISFDNEKSSGPRQLGSLSDSNALSKECYRSSSKTSYSVENSRDYAKSQYITQADAEEFLDVITILKQQHDIDRSLICARNSEIARLTAELEDTKAQLKIERSLRKPSSTYLLSNSYNSGDADSYVVKNKRPLSKSIEFERPQKTYRDFAMNITSLEHKKTMLEPVEELSEDETFTDMSDKSTMNSYSSKVPGRTKTEIEYVIDSEVSSDGEDIYWTNNKGSYHRKTIGTMSRDNDDNMLVDD